MTMSCALMLAGCQNRDHGSDIDLDDVPTYTELADAHNARVALLETMYAYGAVEIRWTDEDGQHFAQGDLDVWLQMPSDIALQVSKASERFFWLGGNSGASWFFDLREDDRKRAELYPPMMEPHGDDVPLALSMTALLEMMGLATIPAERPAGVPDVRHDREHSAWVLSTVASGGPIRLFYDVNRTLPVRVELLSPVENGVAAQLPLPLEEGGNATDNLLLYSVLPLRQYEYIFMPGRANDQFPLVPTLIDVYRTDDTGSIKISVSKPVSDDPSFQSNYFDLDWLLAVLQPDEVRDFRGGRDQGIGGSRDQGAEGNDSE